MKHLTFSTLFALSLTALVSSALFAETVKTEKQVAKGVTYLQEIQEASPGISPRILNLLRIDLKEPGVKLQYSQSHDVIGYEGEHKGRESLQTMAIRNRAVGAVNGDFAAFTGDPLGLGILDGELISEPMDFRACIAMMEDRIEIGVMTGEGLAQIGEKKVPVLLNGVNRIPQEGEIIIETPRFAGAVISHKAGIIVQLGEVNLPLKVSEELTGKVEAVYPLERNEPIPPCPRDKVLLIGYAGTGTSLGQKTTRGDMMTIKFEISPNVSAPSRGKYPSRAGRVNRGVRREPTWKDAKQVIGGGPWLVKEGKISIDYEAEGFDEASFVSKRHPRTAFGVTKDGKVLLLTVDGRDSWSAGASLHELAQIMLKFGAVNAINLDGGGSTSMFVGGGIVNAPSDGRLRPLANSLLLFGDPLDTPDLDNPRIEPNSESGNTFHLNDRLTFHVVQGDGSPLPAGVSVIWGTEDGLGFITQGGAFRSHHTGKGTVVARVGNRVLRAPVSITSGR